MEDLIRCEDVMCSILQYLHPQKRDALHFKLSCSHCKQLVKKLIPLHHIISIFESILHQNQPIPSLEIPSSFVLQESHFYSYFSMIDKSMQQELVCNHLVTKFIVLFHNHPITNQFLLLTHNSLFLLQLAKENHFPNSLAFQTLQTMNRLYSIVTTSGPNCEDQAGLQWYQVNQQWVNEDQWSAVFIAPTKVYKLLCITRIIIPNEKELMDSIIENKDLLLYLVLQCREQACTQLVNHLLSHVRWKQYKTESRLQQVLFLSKHDTTIEKKLVKEYSLSECQDEVYLKSVLKNKGKLLQYLSTEMRRNKQIVMIALESDNSAVSDMAEELKLDKDVVRLLCSKRSYTADELKQIVNHFETEQDFLRELLLLEPSLPISIDWSQNREEVLVLVSKNGSIFSSQAQLRQSWSSDREIVLAAVKSDGMVLHNVGGHLLEDEEIVLTAIKQDPEAIRFINAFKKNKDMALKFVKLNGRTLYRFDEEIRDDIQLIVEAVKSYSSCFTRASKRIRQDYSCIKQILQANGLCFYMLSDELQANEELLRIAVQSNPLILEDLPNELQKNREIMHIAKRFYGITDR